MNIVLPGYGTRVLQRKLYLKAKQAEGARFYTLYDKISRPDILQRAYDLVRANGGSPGLDGRTFEHIESEEGRAGFIDQLRKEPQGKTYRTQAVKRVYIPKGQKELRPLGIPTVRDRVVQMAVKLVLEPIFEADFSDVSYGYRPGRHAHQAIDAISTALRTGHVRVIDMDLSRYFDSIPHDRLLRTVSERIADAAVLGLLKQWLKAPIVEEVDGKRRVVGGGQSSTKGTPQGGVISPLLANIYLNLLDRIWQRREMKERHGACLVRYADDMVVLCRGNETRPFALVKAVLQKLGLQLNESKTRVVNACEEAFVFLGFSIRQRRSKRTGRWFPHVEPAKKSIVKFKGSIKRITHKYITLVPLSDIVRMLNEKLRGWGNYFRYGHSYRQLKKTRTYVEQRLRLQLCYRYKVRYLVSGYVKFPRRALYEKYGLYQLEIKPIWKPAQALG